MFLCKPPLYTHSPCDTKIRIRETGCYHLPTVSFPIAVGFQSIQCTFIQGQDMAQKYAVYYDMNVVLKGAANARHESVLVICSAVAPL